MREASDVALGGNGRAQEESGVHSGRQGNVYCVIVKAAVCEKSGKYAIQLGDDVTIGCLNSGAVVSNGFWFPGIHCEVLRWEDPPDL